MIGLVVVAAILIFVTAILSVPVHVDLSSGPTSAGPIEVRVRWLFGVVRFERSLGGGTKRSETTSNARKPKRGRRRARVLLTSEGVVSRTSKLATDLARSLHPHIDRLRVELGFSDPAETGWAWAVLGPITGWLAARYGGQVSIQPNFSEPTFVIEGQGALVWIPAQTIALVVGAVLTPCIFRGLVRASGV